jgi:ubiquinone biosynthesis protein UbiJ|tara:strand:+ start:768 stop:1373 length:606 start_codon:yes stop_codon:yes gene_type:complete
VNPIALRLEGIVNRVILDSGAAAHLRNLEGRVVAVSIRGLDATGYAAVSNGAIRVIGVPDQAPDITVSGTANGLMQLCRRGADPELFRGGSVRIEGDAQSMLDIKALFSALDWDAEEALAQILGDTLARKAANGARALNRWAKGAADSGAAGLAETLVEETRLLASRPRAERFVDDVETLRDGTARLQQRIERLRAAAKPG